VRPLAWLAPSPEGSRLVWLDREGGITCIDPSGIPLWRHAMAGATRLVVGPEARLTAAYRQDSPLHPELMLIGAQGKTLLLLDCGGPIESVAIAPDGKRVAVGGGAGTLDVLVASGGGWKQRRLPAPGAVGQVLFGGGGELYFSTTGPAGLGRIAPDGKRDWYFAQGGNVEYLIAVSPDGSGIAVAERPRLARGAGTLSLRNRKGRLLWSKALTGRPCTVRVTQGGNRTIVGVERASPSGRLALGDRWLSCFGPDGQRLWRKGGTFFSDPLLVAVDQDGKRILSLARQSQFYLLGEQGSIWWRKSLPSPVQIAVSSVDGSSVAVLFADGQLAWLQTSRASGD
jgi:hypothetical protein